MLRSVIAVDAEVTPSDDEVDPVWQEVGRMRAHAKPVRASESERTGALREVQVYLFTVLTSAMRAMPVSATGHRVRWQGQSYNVREVRLPEGNVAFTEIVAESGVTL